ncbi:DNA polymerase ligase N-terminal domain-containing protein [Streptomyces sp. WG-D5]
MSGKDKLRTYRGKRHFDTTAEPSGDTAAAHGGEEPVFVVQIHDASTMHFDFRLEVDGVLKSWSVPKGPSTDPGDKRLAVPTEDHPLDYRDFEGVIPEAEYGGGTVIVWDRGTYEPEGEDFAKALDDGHATFDLHGEKLRGRYALTRFQGSEAKPQWLLVRTGHGNAKGGTPDPRRARSALSGRTLHQVEDESESGDRA